MNDLGADLELRLVRYFTVVAEHGNFGRAATELRVAQPSLSRQIQRLETRLGVRLLDRTPQGTRLTSAGAAFLPEAHALLRAARRATQTARAHAPEGSIVIGFVEDLVVTAAVRELRRRHPHADIGTRHLDCADAASFAAGTVDVLVARDPLPVPGEGAHVTVLYEEPRVLVMPVDHHLATRASVSPADFAGEDFVCPHGGARAVYPLDADAGPISAGPAGESFEDRLELVASGGALAVLPAGDRRSSLRTDLASVPVEGFPTSKVIVATRAGDPNPLVVDFVTAARRHLTGIPVT